MLDQKEQQYLKDSLPFWGKITEEQRQVLISTATSRIYREGESLHSGSGDCIGFILIKSGQVKVYIISETGKQITLYRLFERDICIFSASCIMRNINFDIYLQAEKDSRVILIPAPVYDSLNKVSLSVMDYTNQLMSSRFSDVMWVMEQVLFMSFDRRLAHFLIEQAAIDASDELSITHETIAKHMGTAREVVTRMLKYFQSEGIVSLSRGGIAIVNRAKLEKLAFSEEH